MKAIRSKVKSKKGDGTASMLVNLLVIMVAFVTVMSIIPVFSKAHHLQNYLDDIARYIELTGSTDGVAEEIARLNDEYYPAQRAPVVDYTSGVTYIPGTTNIQLGDGFTISATFVYRIMISDLISIPINLKAKSSGRSEVYYK